MKKYPLTEIRILLIALLLTVPAVKAVSAGEWRDFNAEAIEYRLNRQPELTMKKFKSMVMSFNAGEVKVVQVKNFITNKKKHDVLIKIAISYGSVGSVVYDSNNNLIAEYGGGKPVSESRYSFQKKNGENTVFGDWFISDDYLVSDFEIKDKNGLLMYKETVIYTAKKSKKERMRR
jgi:hypothetical protein